MQKEAIIVGATGLVGTQLVNLLLNDDAYSTVTIFVRKGSKFQHPKIREFIIDFNKPEEWRDEVRGDVLFSTLGTTLYDAGGKDAQFKVDYTYQYQFALFASYNAVPGYVLVSAAGADAKSALFYSMIKGMLEDAIRKLRFQHIAVLRPGPIKGHRERKRRIERFGLNALGVLNAIGILKKYRPVSARTVAKAMIHVAKTQEEPQKIITLDEVFVEAGQTHH